MRFGNAHDIKEACQRLSPDYAVRRGARKLLLGWQGAPWRMPAARAHNRPGRERLCLACMSAGTRAAGEAKLLGFQ